jgi:hypothetical protein
MTALPKSANSELIELLFKYNQAGHDAIKSIIQHFSDYANLPTNFLKLDFKLPLWNIDVKELKSILHFMIWKIFGATEEMLDMLYKPFMDHQSDSYQRLLAAKLCLSQNEMLPVGVNIPVFDDNSMYGQIAIKLVEALRALRKREQRARTGSIKRKLDEHVEDEEVPIFFTFLLFVFVDYDYVYIIIFPFKLFFSSFLLLIYVYE